MTVSRGRVFGGRPVCRSLVLFLLLLGLFATSLPLSAQPVRQQTINLSSGWNAVFLEVDPLISDPASLFADVPVDIIAAYTTPRRSAQFVGNPSADMLRAYGWGVWYAPHRSDALLTTLYSLNGHTPYLIHSATNVTMTIDGRVPPTRRSWTPNAYNFTGFTVQSPGAPTFAQFFGPSSAHNHNKIYRLVDGTWRQVLDPTAEVMRSGEAFWIYTRGRSDYNGPLDVSVPSVFGLALSRESGSTVTFRNRTGHPLAFAVEHITEHNDVIPMAMVVRAFDEEAPGFRNMTLHFDAGPWDHQFPELEPGAALRLPLNLNLRDAPSGVLHSILRIRTDLGTETYLAVTASKGELP